MSTAPVLLRRILTCVIFGSAVVGATSATAQSLANGRVAVEAVAAVTTSSRAVDDPFVFFDVASTMRVKDDLDVIIRPYARRLPGGDWDAQFYQAQIRYQPKANIRIDAGIIASPLGLGSLELRQDLNPVVGSPFYYFGTLPLFDNQADRVTLLSGGYPLGAIFNMSGSWWDARAGVTDGTPARYRKIFAHDGPSPSAQFIAGGGITPRPGLRVGAGLAQGKYRREDDDDFYGTTVGLKDGDATVFNLEAEYSVGYTRLSGEWVLDRFESQTTPAIARGLYIQAVRTLSPRVFAATRFTRASTPVQVAGSRQRWTRSAAEFTAGYRLTHEITIKGGYEASRRFNVDDWSHAAVGSVVLAKRWF